MKLVLLIFTAMLAAAAEKSAKLIDFSWMEGKWQGKLGEALCEEEFTAPKAGAILNMMRLTQDGKVLTYGNAMLVELDGGLDLRLRHFNAKLEAVETGQPTILKLMKYDGARAEFENFVHSAPKRTIITKKSNDEMEVYSEIIGKDGKTTIHQLTMRRVNR